MSLGERHVKPATIAIILALLVFIPYLNSLFSPFVWDDRTLIPLNPGIKEGFRSVINAFSPKLWGLRADDAAFQSYYRPFHTLLSIMDYSIWGLNPFGYHLSNTIVHYLNTLLVYFFTRRLTGIRTVPFVAAALFALHPVHTEPVSFISSRPDLLCTFFVLASFIMYASSAGGREIFSAKRVLNPRYVLSLVFFLFSLLSKEMSLTFPVLLAAYSLLYEDVGRRFWRVAPFFAIVVLYLVFRVFAVSEFTELHGVKADLPTLIYTASAAVFDYIRLLVVPYPLKSYHPLVWYDSITLKVAAGFVLMLASGGLAVFLLLAGRTLPVFALVWTFLSLAPVLNMGTLGEYSIAERYLYLPSVGFSILFGAVISGLRRDGMLIKRGATVATVVILVLFAAMTVMRNRVWSDDVVFFRDMVRGAPDLPLPHANLAHAYTRAGDIDSAIAELRIAASLAGENPTLLYELGSLLLRQGRASEAIDPLRTAVELKPDFARAYNSLGIALAETGEERAARHSFERALEIDPSLEAARDNIERLGGR